MKNAFISKKNKGKYHPKSAKLLDQVREVLRYHHYAYKTEEAYIHWIRAYIKWNGVRHPRDMGKEEIEGFLSHLAIDRHVSRNTQGQAFNAILFLYRNVLDIDIDESVLNIDPAGIGSF